MIHQISSSLSTFKEVSFRPGLNLVVSEKSPGATDLQTRNSSGKSSLIEIIHFLLGASCDRNSIFRREALNTEEFSMSFDISGLRIQATRSGNSQSKTFVDYSSHTWPVQPKLDKDTGDTWLSRKDWCRVLGMEMFEIDEQQESNYSPSFRSLIPYFVRRDEDGGFHDSLLYYSSQQNWNQQVNLSFLLGLDWQVSQAVNEIRIQEKSLNTLKKEAKSGVLGSLVGTAGELRSRLTVLERDMKQMEKELGEFQVLPEYDDLEKEASVLATEISEMSNQNALDRQRIKDVERQLEDENAPDIPDIEQMYKEAGIVFSELVKKNLDEVRQFNEIVIRNRRTHLSGEIEAANARIQERQERSTNLDKRRIQIIETLSSHGALDQMNRLQAELSRKQADVEEVRKRLEMAKQIESKGTELTIERAHLQQRLTQDLEDQTELLNEAIVIFEDFSRQISDHEGTLTIESTENGPKFDIKVEGKKSKGVRNMQTFCFDMMLSVLWSQKKLGPGFLVHDSHLFDGMDSRQVANALELGANQAAECGFQYLVTLNSDQLKSAEFSADFNPDRFINPVELSDKSKTGGLFGQRI
ncbi:ABC-three component system protein [Gimesia panareensis]|uniref:ABC-three component system protein n=1 Tax=Gimesia panareensis TaxID=2527978 RepID=UPI001188BFCF|nr:ABC-three component system protein [Gimesia panareensis]QDU48438.1 hypothetical protein Pan110_07520 [Gimesia panareensis]